nr:MAG TPA: hypothetical protein [Caudoviricetes sp.]
MLTHPCLSKSASLKSEQPWVVCWMECLLYGSISAMVCIDRLAVCFYKSVASV